jgi:carboxymethylenebutenolidase
MFTDEENLISTGGLTRREFVITTLAAGFALAVRPVTAQTMITTDTTGLDTGEVKIPVADGIMPAYQAMPNAGGPFPVVIVVQEIFGVHEHIKDICRRFAKLGYLAVAPALYARYGDVLDMANVGDIITKVVSQVPDAEVMADLDATMQWAGQSGKGDVSRLGITGFCWGGRIVWLYAAYSPRVKAGVAWYGRLVGPRNERTPQQPLDRAATLKAPVLGLYGGADTGIPTETIEQMRAALQGADSSSRIVVYPDTPHGFHADYRASYHPKQAQDGWQRMLVWFKQYGVV